MFKVKLFMRYLKLFEDNNFPAKQYREVDLQKILNFASDTKSMRIYNSLYDDYSNKTFQIFFISVLREMLIDKEIEFNRVVNPIDGEVSYAFFGRVCRIWLTTHNVVISLYGDKNSYVLVKGKGRKTQIIRIYNSEITEKEQNIEDVEMRLDSEKYNL